MLKKNKDQLNRSLENEKVLQKVKEERAYLTYNNRKLTGLVTSCSETAFYLNVIEWKKEGRIEVTGRRGRRISLQDTVMGKKEHRVKNEVIKSRSVDNWLWKGLWACRKIDYRVNEWMNEWMNAWMNEWMNDEWVSNHRALKVQHKKNVFNRKVAEVKMLSYPYIRHECV